MCAECGPKYEYIVLLFAMNKCTNKMMVTVPGLVTPERQVGFGKKELGFRPVHEGAGDKCLQFVYLQGGHFISICLQHCVCCHQAPVNFAPNHPRGFADGQRAQSMFHSIVRCASCEREYAANMAQLALVKRAV